ATLCWLHHSGFRRPASLDSGGHQQFTQPGATHHAERAVSPKLLSRARGPVIAARCPDISPRSKATTKCFQEKKKLRKSGPPRQRGKAATECREALGVRGACSRFRARWLAPKLQQAGRTLHTLREVRQPSGAAGPTS